VIHTLFDPSIVYAKGGKLLKMLHDLVGDEAWRAGLKNYFEKHQYGNTTRDDLWNALDEVSSIDVPGLMNAWIEHPGQPLVSVTQTGKILNLQQQRLLLDGKDDETLWQIPLLSKNTPELFTKRTEVFELDSDEIVQLNQSGVGHYTVHYTAPEETAAIAQRLADPSEASEWKITYLNGLVMLARHGNTTLAEALESIKKSSDEPRAAVCR
jgi:aminopeptidase N